MRPALDGTRLLRNTFLTSFTALAVGTGLAAGQTPLQQAVTLGKPVAYDAPSVSAHGTGVVQAAAQAATGVTILPARYEQAAATASPAAPVFRGQMDAMSIPEASAVASVSGACFDGEAGPASDNCGPGFWISAEYLHWWVKKGPLLAPLVTLGNPAGANPGAIGDPGTSVLFGGTGLDYGVISGARLTAGGWVEGTHSWGVEGSLFGLSTRSISFQGTTDASRMPFLAVPFNNAVAIPGLFPATGESAFPPLVPTLGTPLTITAKSSTRLWGVDVNGLYNLYRDDEYHAELLGGIRYLDLSESLNLSVSTSVATLPTFLLLSPATATLSDSFRTRNQFIGPQLGLRGGFRCGCFTADFTGKFSIGDMHQSVDIAGNKVATFGSFVASAPGGIFAQPSNIGHRSRDKFAFVPELQAQIGYDVTHNVRAFVGYNLLYATSVVRPGNQVDRTLNLTQLNGLLPTVGPLRPAPQFNASNYWAQGINFGLEFTY